MAERATICYFRNAEFSVDNRIVRGTKKAGIRHDNRIHILCHCIQLLFDFGVVFRPQVQQILRETEPPANRAHVEKHLRTGERQLRPNFRPDIIIFVFHPSAPLLLFETKEIVVGPLTLTGGLIIFPLTYVICRVVCEAWGFKHSCFLICTGFILNYLFLAVADLVDIIPGVIGADAINEGFHAIFGLAPRIALASGIAFLVGSFVSTFTMTYKRQPNGENLVGRLALSSVLAEAADSIVYFPIAFIGLLSMQDMLSQLVYQFVLKTVYEIILIPVVAPSIRKLKELEGDIVRE